MKRTAGLAIAVWLAAAPALAQESRIYTEDGVAASGADVVAYFTEGEAVVPGEDAVTHEWRGATWHFASDAHRQRFAENPERYAPAFGGWCAYAAGRDYAAATVPEAWHIADGTLYLNASTRVNRQFLRDLSDNIAAAEANWPDIF